MSKPVFDQPYGLRYKVDGVQMQLSCQLGSKVPSIEFDDARLFFALPSDAVCCFGGFQRGNLHKVRQEEPDADCGNHADDNL